MSTPVDQREREELCALFLQLGPAAPTLCEGWTTFDLAVHLMLREHFRRWRDDQIAHAKTQGFEDVVARLQRGAPLIPWRLPRLRTILNGTEYFLHHEDVRRANGQTRRADRTDLDDLAWRTTRFLGRRLWRAIRPYGLELRAPNGHRRFGAPPAAIVSGEATELLLYASGRRSAAGVGMSGSPDAVRALKAARVRL